MVSEIRSTAQTLARWVMLLVLLIASSGATLVLANKIGATTSTTAQEEVEERVPFSCQRRAAIRRSMGVVVRVYEKQTICCRPLTSYAQVRVIEGHRIATGSLAPIRC